MSEESKPKVALEVAEEEFTRFVEEMDLEFDERGMDDEDRAAFRECKRRLIKAMVSGALVIDEKGRPVYSPRSDDGGPITFSEPRGGDISQMDSKKTNHTIGKTRALMAAMTHQPEQRFAKLANRDLKVCESILILFLA